MLRRQRTTASAGVTAEIECQSAGFPFLGQSGGATSAERFDIVNPTPGVYAVLVIDFSTAPGPTPYALFNFNLNGTDVGNSTITAPPNAVINTQGTVTLDWNSLAPDTRFFGILRHGDGSSTFGQTEVLIDTR